MEALILQVLAMQYFLNSKINELYSLLPPAATNAPFKRDQLSSGSSNDTRLIRFYSKGSFRGFISNQFSMVKCERFDIEQLFTKYVCESETPMINGHV